MQNQQVAFAFAKEAGRGFEGVFYQDVRPELFNPEVYVGWLLGGTAFAFELDAFRKCFAQFHVGRKERNRNEVKLANASGGSSQTIGAGGVRREGSFCNTFAIRKNTPKNLSIRLTIY